MGQRLKGQEVSLSVTGPAGVEEGLVNILSAEVEFQVENIMEQYLNQVAAQYDEILTGFRGTIEVHPEGSDIFAFIDRIQARAQRRDNAALDVFNLVMTASFPQGDTPRLEFPNVFWAPITWGIGARNEYTPVSFEWYGSVVRFVSI